MDDAAEEPELLSRAGPASRNTSTAHERPFGPLRHFKDTRDDTKDTRKASKRARATKQPSAKRTRPASQTTPTKKSAPTQPRTKSYILLGADEYAKPRAARFTGEDPALLAKAAEAMHLRLTSRSPNPRWPKSRLCCPPAACTPMARA